MLMRWLEEEESEMKEEKEKELEREHDAWIILRVSEWVSVWGVVEGETGANQPVIRFDTIKAEVKTVRKLFF